MKYPHFIGGSYESPAVTAANMRTVNWYQERIEDPGGTARVILLPTPGAELIVQTNSTGGRAHLYIDGREFAVIGTAFLEIDEDGAVTSHGTIAINSNPATISSNGDGGGELFITSGGNGYLFVLATNTLSTIAALVGKATMGDQIDGYFLALDADTGTLYSSELLDGATWNTGTMFAQRNAAPDPWIAMKVKGRYIYLDGEQTGETWYDAGDSPFPFAPHPSGGTEYGIAAAFSSAICDTSLCWLGASKSGRGMVLRKQGFTAETISTYAVQHAINGYDVVSDAYGDSYTEAGHTFYVLTFPTANKTWVYDLQMGQWHERGAWVTSALDFSAWAPRCHAFAFGEHRWLHGTGTGVYRTLLTLGTDVDTLPIRRLRRAPTIEDENRLVSYQRFELDAEPGLGLVSGQGVNPQAMMRFSNDGGKTWSAERWASLGRLGEYGKRIRWLRLGSGRRRIFEVVVTDPVPCRLTNAYLDIEQEWDAQRRSA